MTERLSCVIKIFASILMINRILYNQKRIFFNAFKSSRYFRFIALYQDFDSVHSLFSYREKCRLSILRLICEKVTFHFFKLKFIVNIISSVKKNNSRILKSMQSSMSASEYSLQFSAFSFT